MSSKITQEQKLQLLGLITLARQHSKIVDDVHNSITQFVGVDDSVLHDAIWDYDMDFEKALKDSQIEVEDAAA